HVDGLLMGIEAITRAIDDLDAVEGDIGILAVGTGDVTVEPAIYLAGSGVTVAIQSQVVHAEVVGFFAVGRTDNARHFGVGTVLELDNGLTHARAAERDIAF